MIDCTSRSEVVAVGKVNLSLVVSLRITKVWYSEGTSWQRDGGKTKEILSI